MKTIKVLTILITLMTTSYSFSQNKAVSDTQKRVQKANYKKSKELTSIKAYRKSLKVRIKTVKLS